MVQRTENTCIALAAQNNVLYHKMLSTLEEMAKAPGKDWQDLSLGEQLTTFLALQKQIATNANTLNAQLQQLDDIPEDLEKLLQEKKTLLEKTLHANNLVTKQAEAMKSLLGEEMKKIKSGHTALRGYQEQGAATSRGFRRSL